MEDILKMAGYYGAHAIWSVADGETLIPMLGYLATNNRTSMQRLAMESAAAFALAETQLSSPGADNRGVVFIRDAVIKLASGKTDSLALDVAFTDRPAVRLQVLIPYRHAQHPAGFAVHRLQVTRADGIPEGDIQGLINAFVDGIDSHPQGGALYRERYEPEAGATAGHFAAQNPDFSPEEFEQLKRSPVLIFLLVAAIDGNVDAKELNQFVEGLLDRTLLENKLLNRIVTNMVGEAPGMILGMVAEQPDFLGELLHIKSILDEKLPPAEATAFKQALLAIGQRVASASGGFLGFGKVSRKEKDALHAIAFALGIAEG